MTLDWYAAHPIHTGLAVLSALAVSMAVMEYWLAPRYDWALDPKWTLVGWAAGLVPAFLAVLIFGVKAAILATIALVVSVGVILWIDEPEPETLDVDNHLRGED